MAKLLVVEDDADLKTVLVDLLESENYVVETVSDGQEAIEFLETYKYDVVVLDWELPGMSGIDVCKKSREKGIKTPIIMLTGKSQTDDKIAGLDTGADDYLTKPFESKELLARIRSLLRRPEEFSENVLEGSGISLDPSAHIVSQKGKSLELHPKEFALLEYLMRHPNEVFSGEQLLDRVWSADSSAAPTVVRTNIHTLRKKLSANGNESPIQTVHGVGYKFESKDQ